MPTRLRVAPPLLLLCLARPALADEPPPEPPPTTRTTPAPRAQAPAQVPGSDPWARQSGKSGGPADGAAPPGDGSAWGGQGAPGGGGPASGDGSAWGPEGRPDPMAADPEARNAIFLELLGNGLLYSINYDRRIGHNWSVRAGLMYLSLGASASTADEDGGSSTKSAKVSFFVVPLMANRFFGGLDHKFELGLGVSILHASGKTSGFTENASGSGTAVAGTGAIGYRYTPHDGGFFFRAGLAPIFNQDFVTFWPGVSLGGVF